MIIYLTCIAFIAAAAAIILSLKAIASTRRRAMLAGRMNDFPYVFHWDFISPPQRLFFAALQEAVADKLFICPRPHLVDLIAPLPGLTPVLQQAALERISGQHVDFLLVTKKDCVPVAMVELDDGQQPMSRMERDVVVDAALRSAGLAVVRIQADASTEAAAFRELLAPVLEHDPVRPHASETRPPFAVMTVSLPPQPFAQAQSAKPVRTLMELQEELNRTRSPFMDRENMDREKGENVVA